MHDQRVIGDLVLMDLVVMDDHGCGAASASRVAPSAVKVALHQWSLSFDFKTGIE
jgi:hypothetical protein